MPVGSFVRSCPLRASPPPPSAVCRCSRSFLLSALRSPRWSDDQRYLAKRKGWFGRAEVHRGCKRFGSAVVLAVRSEQGAQRVPQRRVVWTKSQRPLQARGGNGVSTARRRCRNEATVRCKRWRKVGVDGKGTTVRLLSQPLRVVAAARLGDQTLRRQHGSGRANCCLGFSHGSVCRVRLAKREVQTCQVKEQRGPGEAEGATRQRGHLPRKGGGEGRRRVDARCDVHGGEHTVARRPADRQPVRRPVSLGLARLRLATRRARPHRRCSRGVRRVVWQRHGRRERRAAWRCR
mmetsp:Transcript_7062/g.22615  ORF Transcript_7062/g.22615 Transcript_7062/m.22615 type:complete len:292 (-) Transcript_7062:1565-2440(-)